MISYLSRNLEGNQNKPLVLLLHAFPLNAEMWLPTLILFGNKDWPILAPTVYGTNGSEEKKNWNFTQYASELIELARYIGYQKVIPIGVSMGGYVAFEILRSESESIAGLVLCNTKGESDTEEGKKQRDSLIKQIEERGNQVCIEQNLPKLLGHTTKTNNPELSIDLGSLIKTNRKTSLIEQIKALKNRNDSTELMKGIKQPTLVIAGNEDELMSPEVVKKIYEGIPETTKKEFIEIQKSGHLSVLEQPEHFHRSVEKFIEPFMNSMWD
ncbi:MAG: alpha/beta hydrolase [Chloroherpetonaceae bacterium]|nr:alpha/beta hydrolase [Chloroherpetonaceae bacterium]